MTFPKRMAATTCAVIFLLTLTGATLAQWRKRSPRWTGVSSKSFVDLEGCLGSKWAATQSTKYDVMPIERGISYTNAGEQRDILVDVTDDGDHRTIKLWLRTYLVVKV